MSKRNCCVINCNNSGYELKNWRNNYCNIHQCNYGTSRCICNPPFELLTFPSEKKDAHSKSVWAKNVYRINSDGSNWQPNENSRICSHHFIDGFPTTENPYPTLLMGHDYPVITKSRPPPKERYDTPPKEKKCNENKHHLISVNNMEQSCLADHDYLEFCETCKYKEDEIKKLKSEISQLHNKLEKSKFENKIQVHASVLSKICSTDKKMKFYTGIPTVETFNKIFDVIQPHIQNLRYWKGPNYPCNPLKNKKIRKPRLMKKTTAKEEMALTLMKLRLGLLDEDLADRFNISSSKVSRIFTTWIKILAKYLGSLIFNPSKEVVRSNLPPKFQTCMYSDVRHIIDCSEIFIEKPQSLNIQSRTWSDYKHHHTAKFLVSITPSGMINYISDCWGGRASDKHITNNSGFLDIIEPYDTILADRGFQIQEEITLLNARLIVPPSRKGVAQMSKADVLKTKEVANRRIYVEQAIRRMKQFRITKFEVPLTLCQHLDEICKIVGGICNLYPKLPKYKA